MASYHYLIKILQSLSSNRTATFSNYNEGRWHNRSLGGNGNVNREVQITIPNDITITSAKIVHQYATSVGNSTYCSVSANRVTIKNSDNTQLHYDNHTSGTGTVMANLSSTVVPGETLTCTFEIYFSSGAVPITAQNTSSATYSASASKTNVYLDLTCTIPPITDLLRAIEINAFAKIFNTTEVTADTPITLAPVQELGTAVGQMYTTTEENPNPYASSITSNTVGAVNFDTSYPLSSDIQQLITKMTDNYYAP